MMYQSRRKSNRQLAPVPLDVASVRRPHVGLLRNPERYLCVTLIGGTRGTLAKSKQRDDDGPLVWPSDPDIHLPE